jgi:hypothetical protein
MTIRDVPILLVSALSGDRSIFAARSGCGRGFDLRRGPATRGVPLLTR